MIVAPDSPRPMLHHLLGALPETQRAEAACRYAAQERTLGTRLAALYGHQPGFEQWLAGLLARVGALMAARPPALRALDAQRAARPDWFLSQRMLGYCAYVDRFGGTLDGVAARIPHLRELGVSYLHLLPFLKPRAGENDGGFAVSSYDEVDARLGSVADLEALAARLRESGISLCSDFILNHVADDHAWAVGAKQGDAALRGYFHVFPDRTMPDRYERTLGQVFPQVAPGNFTRVDEMEGWVWTTFYPYQWDLNYANPAVFAEMALAMLRLANRGIEVFRLDSTAFLWKREGTASMNQPEAHAILQALRALTAIAAPGVLLKAEAIVPTRELPAYFGEADAAECHIAYHSSLMAAGWGAVAEQDAALLRAVAAGTPPLPGAACWLSYVRCHDDIGWNVLRAEAGQDPARLAAIARFYTGANGSFALGAAFQSSDPDAAHGSNGATASLLGLESARTDEERELALRRMHLLHGLALAFGALPVLYMGDEFAQRNDYGYRGRPRHAMDSRWLQRPGFDDEAYAQRNDVGTLPGRAYRQLRALVEARGRLPALDAAAPRSVLPSAPAVLALARGDGFLCLCNFSAQEQGHALEGGWTDSLTGRPVSGEVVLAPWSLHWLERAA